MQWPRDRGCRVGSGTKSLCLFLQGETKGYDSLVKIEGLDWPLKAERPFPVSSSEIEDSKMCNFKEKFREIETLFLGLSVKSTTRKTTTFEIIL